MYQIYAMRISDRFIESSNVFLQTDYNKKVLITYYFWLLQGTDKTILIDTGISQDELSCRSLEGPTREEMLARVNIQPGDIDAVIISHLHNDHFAEPDIYTKALYYVQRKELEYWSGDVQGIHVLSKPQFLNGRPAVDLMAFQKLNSEGRVRLLDGDNEIYPGLSVILLGGHTPGHQLVKVNTARGDVLLCVDFADTYRNLEERIPTGTYTNLLEWMSGINRIELMRLPKESLIPGHDPLVMSLFPEIAKDVVKIA